MLTIPSLSITLIEHSPHLYTSLNNYDSNRTLTTHVHYSLNNMTLIEHSPHLYTSLNNMTLIEHSPHTYTIVSII